MASRFISAIPSPISVDVKDLRASLYPKWMKTAIQTVLILSAFPADWSCIAVLAILGMYRERGNLEKQMFTLSDFGDILSLYVYACLKHSHSGKRGFEE